MMQDFELHEFFHSPKNVLLKALLYIIIFFASFWFVDWKSHIIHVRKNGDLWLTWGALQNGRLLTYSP